MGQASNTCLFMSSLPTKHLALTGQGTNAPGGQGDTGIKDRHPVISLATDLLEGVNEAKWGLVAYSGGHSWRWPLPKTDLPKVRLLKINAPNTHWPNLPIPPTFLSKDIPS